MLNKAFECVDHNKLWNSLKDMGTTDHLTCLLRKLHANEGAKVTARHGTDWFKIGKEVLQSCILSTCLFNSYTESIMGNTGLDETTSWNHNFWEKYKLPQICRWQHPYGRKWRGTKEPLDESEREEWKSWLKTQHSRNYDLDMWSHHFMAIRWGNNENSNGLYFWGLQNHCWLWVQPWN